MVSFSTTQLLEVCGPLESFFKTLAVAKGISKSDQQHFLKLSKTFDGYHGKVKELQKHLLDSATYSSEEQAEFLSLARPILENTLAFVAALPGELSKSEHAKHHGDLLADLIKQP